MRHRLFLTAGLALLTFSGAARADDYISATLSGTVVNGIDTQGYFGTAGTDLTGSKITITFSYDFTLLTTDPAGCNTFTVSPSYDPGYTDYCNDAAIFTSVTINNRTIAATNFTSGFPTPYIPNIPNGILNTGYFSAFSPPCTPPSVSCVHDGFGVGVSNGNPDVTIQVQVVVANGLPNGGVGDQAAVNAFLAAPLPVPDNFGASGNILIGVGFGGDSLFFNYSLTTTPGYVQTNLVSNSPGVAPALTTDPNLLNPWGIAASPTSPFWVADQASGVSTLYSGSGVPGPLIVTVPPPAPPPSGPTGVVFNSTTGFPVDGSPASFIFDTLDGTIDAWNAAADTRAVVKMLAPAAFTGLTTGSAGGSNYLYAADFANNQIDVFDSSFNPVVPPGSFRDYNLPTPYSPYNIRNINGNLYVEYAFPSAVPGQPVAGLGQGFVEEYDTNGNFIQRVISAGVLNAPWGIALAPPSFGPYGGDLLVGNFGDGKINAFNPTTGAFLGIIDNTLGEPLVNDNLRALYFGSGAYSNTLYFTAGLDNQTGGLFGSIQPVDSAIALQVSPTTLVYPGSADVSVCVTPGTNAPATGTVRILDGTTLLATLTLQGNGCGNWYINPPLNAGAHALSAVYSGDNNNPAGTSAPVTVTVSPTPSYLNASCGSAGFTYGGSYNCKVTVGSAVGVATGAINYIFDTNPPVIMPLIGGTAQFSLTTPSAGSHTVAIGYAQQGNFAAAGPATETFTVSQATTEVSLTPSSYYPSAGAPFTLSASVTSYSAAPPASGTVTFYNNGASIGTSPVNAQGQAILKIPALAAGYYSLQAQFGGLPPDYAAAGSNYLTIQAQAH